MFGFLLIYSTAASNNEVLIQNTKLRSWVTLVAVVVTSAFSIIKIAEMTNHA